MCKSTSPQKTSNRWVPKTPPTLQNPRFLVGWVESSEPTILLTTQLPQPPFEKPAFGLLLREREGAFVRRACVLGPPEPAAEFGASGMGEMVVGQVAARQNGVHELQSDGG